MKRNLIKGSAGNVSTTIKIRRINCFFLGSKRGLEGGKQGWREGTKYSRGRGRQGEKGTQEKVRERQRDKIREIIDAADPRGPPGPAGRPGHAGAARGEVGEGAPCCPLPGDGRNRGEELRAGAAGAIPPELTNTAAPSSACSASRWRCKSHSFPRLRGWQILRAGALQMEAELLCPSHHGSAR